MIRYRMGLVIFLLMFLVPRFVQAHPGPPTNQPASARPLIWQGSRGPAVSDLQRMLNTWIAQSGAGLRPLAVDGIFGPKTDAAVRAYQRAKGLAVDGVVGPQTWGALLGPAAAPRPATTRPATRAPGSSPSRPINTGGRDLYNCGDFASQEEANRIFLANQPGDPNRLDRDNDGIPCEE